MFLLFLRAMCDQDLGVADIGRLTIEQIVTYWRAPQFFTDPREL